MAARSGARKRDTAIPSRTTACGETRPAGVDSPGTMKYWEIIADDLTKAGWSWGCVSAVDAHGRTIWIADAHRGDRKRFGLCVRMKGSRRLLNWKQRFTLGAQK